MHRLNSFWSRCFYSLDLSGLHSPLFKGHLSSLKQHVLLCLQIWVGKEVNGKWGKEVDIFLKKLQLAKGGLSTRVLSKSNSIVIPYPYCLSRLSQDVVPLW